MFSLILSGVTRKCLEAIETSIQILKDDRDSGYSNLQAKCDWDFEIVALMAIFVTHAYLDMQDKLSTLQWQREQTQVQMSLLPAAVFNGS